jgi:hypothetical protein
LKGLSFSVLLAEYYDVLLQVNVDSKSIQSRKFDVCKSVELVEDCHEFLKENKAIGLQRAISAVTEFASQLRI